MSHDLDRIRISGLEHLKAEFSEETVERAVELTGQFEVEVPGWQLWAGFGGGGRFESAGGGGAARNAEEIARDAALIHSLTAATPAVGQHVLWGFSGDGRSLDYELAVQFKATLAARGLRLGSISPTYFLAGSEDGSLSAQDPETRRRYIEQTIFGARVAAELGSGILTLWFPDGTNYPGQRELQDKLGLLREGLSEFWERTPEKIRRGLESVLVEYKVFEPGTYSTTVPDWGVSLELSRIFGDKGGVLIDLGHHHHGTNIEQIAAALIVFGVRSGLHFNTRYAADDDHSVQADYPLSCLFHELVSGGVIFNPDRSRNWSFCLDQMARAEERIPSVLKSVDALKRSVARALLFDSGPLETPRRACDLIGANAEFERALLHADTGPLVMESLHRRGLHPVPLTAYRESGYQSRIEAERSRPLA